MRLKVKHKAHTSWTNKTKSSWSLPVSPRKLSVECSNHQVDRKSRHFRAILAFWVGLCRFCCDHKTIKTTKLCNSLSSRGTACLLLHHLPVLWAMVPLVQWIHRSVWWCPASHHAISYACWLDVDFIGKYTAFLIHLIIWDTLMQCIMDGKPPTEKYSTQINSK